MKELTEKILNNVRGAKQPAQHPQAEQKLDEQPLPQQEEQPKESGAEKEENAFAKMRVALKEKEKALEEAAKSAEQLKRTMEALQKEKEELSNTLAKVKFTESELFKEKYQRPVERSRARLAEYAKLYGISDDDMKKLMSDADIKSRYETAGKLFGAASPLVVETLDQLRVAEAERNKAVEEWQQAAPKHILELQQAEKKARLAQVAEKMEEAEKELQQSILYLQPSNVDTQWNDRRTALLAQARKLAEVDEPVQTAAVFIKAALFDQAYSDLLQLMKQNKELAAKNGELESSFPTLSRSVAPQRSVPQPKKDETTPVTPSSLVAAIMSKKLVDKSSR